MLGKPRERGADSGTGSTRNIFSSWLSSYLVPVTSSSSIVAVVVFLLSLCFPTLAWLPSLFIFAYLESGGRMRERRRGMEEEVEEERKKLREEMTRLAMEQKELKIRFEEEFAVAHNQLMNQATGKEATLAANFEQNAAEEGSNEGSLEEDKNGLDANLEERVGGAASKLEESLLLRLEAKLEQMVEAAIRLKLEEAKQEELEKSLKVEEVVEREVRLRLRAEHNHFDNSSTNRSGFNLFHCATLLPLHI